MAVRLGVMADTHGLVRPAVAEVLQGCDAIVHAGDFHRPAVLEALRAMAPVYAVRGNNDGEWAEALPRRLAFQVEGVRFLMAHERRDLPPDGEGAQVLVYGHSHRYEMREAEGRLYLNPGSCGPRRFRLEVTMAVMTVERGGWTVEKILLPEEV